MRRHLSLEELPRKVTELGHEYIELSARDNFLARWVNPPIPLPSHGPEPDLSPIARHFAILANAAGRGQATIMAGSQDRGSVLFCPPSVFG
jgi:hypothetical protein